MSFFLLDVGVLFFLQKDLKHWLIYFVFEILQMFMRKGI